MIQLDVELDDELINRVKRLATHHYGDASDGSIVKVVESALEMRLLATILVEGGGNETEEPIRDWEFGNKQPAKQLPAEIQSQLFRRR